MLMVRRGDGAESAATEPSNAAAEGRKFIRKSLHVDYIIMLSRFAEASHTAFAILSPRVSRLSQSASTSIEHAVWVYLLRHAYAVYSNPFLRAPSECRESSASIEGVRYEKNSRKLNIFRRTGALRRQRRHRPSPATDE